MHAGVSWLSFLPLVPADTRETLGSWQSWKTSGGQVTLAVPSVTFPSFLPSEAWDPGFPRIAHLSFCSF